MKRTELRRRTPLRTLSPLRQGCKPLQRKTPLAPVSAKRRTERRVYSEMRLAYLDANPVCQFPLGCTNAATDVHHKAGRVGSLYLDETRWAALCRGCHDWTTRHPRAAYELGISERRVS